MAWDDAPPSPQELGAPKTASWDSAPPTGPELEKAFAPPSAASDPPPKSRFSLPASWEDAFHRLVGGGLFLTPQNQPKLPEVDPAHPPTLLSDGNASAPENANGSADMSNMRGGAPPMPLGALAGAAVTGGAMAADSYAHGDKTADVVKNALIGAGAGAIGGLAGSPTVGNAAHAAADAVGNMSPTVLGVAGHVLGIPHGMLAAAIPTAAKAVGSSVGSAIVSAAARQGPQQAAIAHYLATQRDPAYAAAQQKKDDK